MENTSLAATDEVSLIDLWKVIYYRKNTVYIVLLLSIVIAISVAMFTPSIYESKAVISVGKVTDQLIEDPKVLVQRLIQEYQVGDDSEHVKVLPYVESVDLDKKGNTTVITITSRGSSAEEAKNYLENVVNKLLKEHEALFQRTVGLEEERLKSMKQEIGQLDNQIERVNKLTGRLKDRDPNQAAVLAIESGKYLSIKPNLEGQYARLGISLSGLKTQPTQVFREPTLPRKALKPSLKFFIALGIILGMFLGIFSAFIHEFVVNTRKELMAETSEER